MKRRKFLLQSSHLAFSSAYMYGLQSLIETCFGANRAFAQSSEELYYLNIQMAGAPPRWYFDQPLNPFNSGSDFKAGQYGTEITKVGSNFRPIHRGYKLKFGDQDVFLPPVWRLTSAGTGKKFSELLDHTMMIRGIDMEINSHTVNRTRVVRPVASKPSINGLVADKSNLPIAAVGGLGESATDAFKSENGLGVVAVAVGNPVPALIDAFKGKIITPDNLGHSVTQVMDQLDSYANHHGLASIGVEQQQMSAYKMFEEKLTSFNQKYANLYKKYQEIVSKEIRANFPNITNVNPVSDNSDYFSYNRGVVVNGSLNATINAETNLNRTAMTMAFAEFALTEKLSSSVNINISSTVMSGVKGIGNITCDQHYVGAVASIFYTSLYYRAFMGCLLELKDQLQAAGIFDKTLIHIMTEFSRTPRMDGSGSDHGYNGNSATLISGMITTPGLIGNIVKNTHSDDPVFKTKYPGTWGEAGNFNFPTGRRKIVNDDIVNTVCEIMGVAKIAVKGQPLARKSGSSVEWLSKWEVKNV